MVHDRSVGRSRRSRSAPMRIASGIAVIAAVVVFLPAPVSGQSRLLSYTAGSSIGVFAAYPSDFADESCSQRVGGFSAWLSGPVTHSLVLEGRGTITTPVGGQTCSGPSIVSPGEGATYSRERLDDAIHGISFFATQLSLVFDPARTARVSPRVRVGAGRLWDKRIWNWFYGAEARITAGPGSLVAGVERWNLGFDITTEQWIWHDLADDEFVSSTTARRIARPWLLTVGWEGPVW